MSVLLVIIAPIFLVTMNFFAIYQWMKTHRQLMKLIDAVTRDKQFDSNSWRVSDEILSKS